MSGRTDALPYFVLALSLLAVVTDLWKGKIYNWLTIPAFLGGFSFSAMTGGWQAVGGSALGAGLALLLYGWIFAIGMMGAGDVKFLMALGAIGGASYALQVGLLAIMIGGAMALVILAVKGRIRSFAEKLYRSVISLLVKELEFTLPQVDRKLTLPFGVPIAIAAVWTSFGHPLQHWGIFL